MNIIFWSVCLFVATQPRSKNWFLTQEEWDENKTQDQRALINFSDALETEVEEQNVPVSTEDDLKQCHVKKKKIQF